MKRILIQLDTDPHPSSFDRVVAVDAGVDELCSYGSVTPENVEPLVHGAMFTRRPADLKQTAIFVGGSNVAASDAVFQRVRDCFFGPVRVSVMADANGSNTTAAAAVLAAGKHLDLSQVTALVLGGTGPVGQRAAQLLAAAGAAVRIASRSLDRARQTCDAIAALLPGSRLTACESGTEAGLFDACQDVTVIIAAGAVGVTFLTQKLWAQIPSLRVAIDLNAVPPTGLEGVDAADKAVEKEGVVCYGAIGVGGTKMKIHKAALRKLFENNDLVLDTAAIYTIGRELTAE
ncbi:MAG: bifunctional NADP-dependent methylenetetrahydromethanopterin dehydrogenase/methylenetetrahydrofolate dehydrogenase [Planctomycetes bacterium]|nr:bifunctional NADP-dependent methylenetetrahydromethanopterin dehydrogenase/methylenetetrahydrofolate dehydrogenase [Planctomycetota bacterium]